MKTSYQIAVNNIAKHMSTSSSTLDAFNVSFILSIAFSVDKTKILDDICIARDKLI